MNTESVINIFKHPCNRGRFMGTIIKLMWWKYNQVFIHKPTVVELATGVKCLCYPDSSYGGMVVYTTLPEYHEMQYFLNNVNGNSVVVDIGANIGVYTLLASSKINTGKIFAIEPSGKPFEYLNENVSLNEINDRVTLLNCVVSDKVGKVNFNECEISELSHISYSKRSGLVKDSISLDKLFNKHKIRQVDILKIDVEGGEGKVMDGAENSMKQKKIKKIIMELNNNNKLYGTSHKQISNKLLDYGYSLSIFENNGSLVKLSKSYYFDQNKNYNILAEI